MVAGIWDHKGTSEVIEIVLLSLDCEGSHSVLNCILKMGTFYCM